MARIVLGTATETSIVVYVTDLDTRFMYEGRVVTFYARVGGDIHEASASIRPYALNSGTATIRGLSPGTYYDSTAVIRNIQGSPDVYLDGGSFKTAGTYIPPPMRPDAPSSGWISSSSNRSLTFAWSSVSNATAYDVLFNGTLYQTTSTSMSFSSLSGSTSYTADIYASNSAGMSLDYCRITGSTDPDPVLPRLATPVFSVLTSTEYTISATLDHISGAVYYGIVLWEEGKTYFEDTQYGPARSFYFPDLKPNTNYRLVAYAQGSGYRDSYEKIEYIATKELVPPGKPTLTLSNVTHTSVTLRAVASGVTHFEISYLQVGVMPDWAIAYSSTTSPFTISNLEDGAEYFFEARSIRNGLYSGYSSTLRVNTPRIIPNRPLDWKWNTTTNSSGNKLYIMKASTWNAFTKCINAFRSYANVEGHYYPYPFIEAKANNAFTVDMYNQAVHAINPMCGYGLVLLTNVIAIPQDILKLSDTLNNL